MHVQLSRETLFRAVSLLSSAVDRRHTMPILSNVKIDAQPGQIVLTTSDLEVELVGTLHVDDAAVVEPGSITVPCRKLADILKTLTTDLVSLQSQANEQRCLIRAGKGRFTLSTLPATDFPLLGQVNLPQQVVVQQDVLKALLERTAFAMAVQDVRFYLTGTLIEAEANLLRAVTTDGHRLAMSQAPAQLQSGEGLAMIVPRKAIAELQHLLKPEPRPLALAAGREFMSVTLPASEKDIEQGLHLDVQLSSKLIDGKFPDYRRVIPRNGDKRVLVERVPLQQSLQRVAVLSHEKLRGIVFDFANAQLTLRANNIDQDEAVDELVIDYTNAPLTMSFNGSYMQDVLGVLNCDQVQLTLSEPSASALIQAPEQSDTLYVVMPMRI